MQIRHHRVDTDKTAKTATELINSENDPEKL